MIVLNDFDLSKESFDIKPELKVSKIINEHSDKVYTNKNGLDPYDYDLNCFNKESGQHIGFVEVEVSNYKLLDGKKWKHSFLKRKVYEWDKERFCFTDNLRKYYEQTVYIKFNCNFGLTDCICCDISTIKNFNEERQEKTGRVKQDLFFRTEKFDKRVAVGIGNCIRYIEHKFIDFNKLDNWM